MNFDSLSPETIKAGFGGAALFAVAAALCYGLLYFVGSALKSNCKEGPGSWAFVTNILTAECPFTYGLAWSLGGCALSLIILAISAPIGYYHVCLLEKQTEEHRIEQRVTEEAMRQGYEQVQGMNGNNLWKKAVPHTSP